ncbi:gas vesicle protein V [Roseibium sp. SCP14]|uniref:gas vesicle protein V n=1 Tax=Roseibium sp. SCP14 TaxID=3141375 RepID=UPI003337FD65
MPPLTNYDQRALSETQALRDRRDFLLREAHRLRFRLSRIRDLQEELQQITTILLQRELEAKRKPNTRPEPLGDAGAVGGHHQNLFPYKD